MLHEEFEFADWRTQHRPWRHDYGPLDEILQFPNIARPHVSADDLHDVVGNHIDYFVHSSSEGSNEVANKLRDIFGALPNRGESDGEYVEPVEQIGAEPPLLDHLH